MMPVYIPYAPALVYSHINWATMPQWCMWVMLVTVVIQVIGMGTLAVLMVRDWWRSARR